MLDTSLVFAPHLALALAADRERVAESRKWLRDLRDIEARERAERRKPRAATINASAHFSHKL